MSDLDESDSPLIKPGDTVALLLANGSHVQGEVINAYSGKGATDGLLKMRSDTTGQVVFVYERHIALLRVQTPSDEPVA